MRFENIQRLRRLALTAETIELDTCDSATVRSGNSGLSMPTSMHKHWSWLLVLGEADLLCSEGGHVF